MDSQDKRVVSLSEWREMSRNPACGFGRPKLSGELLKFLRLRSLYDRDTETVVITCDPLAWFDTQFSFLHTYLHLGHTFGWPKLEKP